MPVVKSVARGSRVILALKPASKISTGALEVISGQSTKESNVLFLSKSLHDNPIGNKVHYFKLS